VIFGADFIKALEFSSGPLYPHGRRGQNKAK